MKEHGALSGEPKKQIDNHPAGIRGEVDVPQSWESMTEFVWRRQLSVKATDTLEFAPSPVFPNGGRVEDLVFFDIETTGLSGGAGTHVFLVGFGTVKAGRLTIEQFFLRDYPGELEFLDLIQKSMDSEKTNISPGHKYFAMCEINHKQYAVDEGVAKCDQSIDTAGG